MKIYGRVNVTISLRVSLTSQWLHLNNLFYKTSTLTPFVKPRQVLSYLDVAIAKKLLNLRLICLLLQPCFVGETRKNWSQKYLVIVSRGAPDART